MSCGYLELIVGPMFSGKTTRLIEIYNKYNRTNKNVVAINYCCCFTCARWSIK